MWRVSPFFSLIRLLFSMILLFSESICWPSLLGDCREMPDLINSDSEVGIFECLLWEDNGRWRIECWNPPVLKRELKLSIDFLVWYSSTDLLIGNYWVEFCLVIIGCRNWIGVYWILGSKLGWVLRICWEEGWGEGCLLMGETVSSKVGNTNFRLIPFRIKDWRSFNIVGFASISARYCSLNLTCLTTSFRKSALESTSLEK